MTNCKELQEENIKISKPQGKNTKGDWVPQKERETYGQKEREKGKAVLYEKGG